MCVEALKVVHVWLNHYLCWLLCSVLNVRDICSMLNVFWLNWNEKTISIKDKYIEWRIKSLLRTI